MSGRLKSLLVAVMLLGGVSVGSLHATAAIGDGPQIRVRPVFGPGGTKVHVQGRGFQAQIGFNCPAISISFIDAKGVETALGTVRRAESFTITVTVPNGAALGPGSVEAKELGYNPGHHMCSVQFPLVALADFAVTG